MQNQYVIKPIWDPNLLSGGMLKDSGLIASGVYSVAGAPANVANKYIPGALIINMVDKILYQNQGTTAAPSFEANGASGYETNVVTSAPGLKVDTVAHLTVTNNNAFFLRQGSAGVIAISGLTATHAFPALTGPNLAFDNGSQPETTPSCRCYTFFAAVDPVTSAVTLSVLYGADFPKHRPARTSDFNLGDGSLAIVGYLYVKNESNAVFIPGTTTLNASGITADPSDQFGFPIID